LLNFNFWAPPILEQSAIAQVLSDTDALIASLDKLIAKKRNIKQAAMQQLLTGKQRLPGFDRSGGKFKQTAIGAIPCDWEIFSLQELVKKTHPITYGVLKPGDYVSDGVPLLQIQDVIHGDIRLENLHRISQQLNKQYSRTKLQGGEIVVSLVGTIGKFAHIPSFLSGANLHRNLAKISIADERSSKFIFYCLTSEYVQKLIKLTTFGSTQSLLNLADLRKLAIAIPSNREQRSIAQVLSDMDAEITALEQRRDKTKALKQGMMQELLTGRIRLKA
jgi:type I restriction enzyme S subunit